MGKEGGRSCGFTLRARGAHFEDGERIRAEARGADTVPTRFGGGGNSFGNVIGHCRQRNQTQCGNRQASFLKHNSPG